MAKTCPECGATILKIGAKVCNECEAALDPSSVARDSDEEADAVGPGMPGVWYATEARLHAWFRIGYYDDRGEIYPVAEGAWFTGSRQDIQMLRLTAEPRLERRISPASILELIFGNALILVLGSIGMFTYLTLDNPATYVFLVAIDLFVIAVWPKQWVCVEYVDELDRSGKAFFTMSSALRRWRGGARRLHQQLQKWVLMRTESTSQEIQSE